MIHAFTPACAAPVLALATDPVVILWATGWLAAAFGMWLRATLPPVEDEEVTAILAGFTM